MVRQSFGAPGPICAILEEGIVIVRNNPVKLFLIWTSGSGINAF